MLFILLRKMLSSKWMILCLLTGSILTVAMVSSIPVYTYGILQKMLTRDLESLQESSNVFPVRYHIDTNIFYNIGNVGDRIKFFNMADLKIKKMAGEIGLPIMSRICDITTVRMIAVPEIQREEKPIKRYFTLKALSDFQEHAGIINGRMFSTQKQGDVYEVVVNEKTMSDLDLRLGEVYSVFDINGIEKGISFFKVKVVGIFNAKDVRDEYWYSGTGNYNDCFIMDYRLYIDSFTKSQKQYFERVEWDYTFDYHKITLNNLKSILSSYEIQSKWYGKYSGIFDFKMLYIPILEQNKEREKQLSMMLWVLQTPILLMLAFYIFMVSQLIIKYEENEIAVFKSRGASNIQIFANYFIEGLVLSVITLLTGPILGLFMCKILGSTNGFLEFVQRTALPVRLDLKAYIYSLLALALFIITMLVPVYMSSRTTIVQYKQKKVRSMKASVWKKYFIDVLLLAIAGYGYYCYKKQTITLSLIGINGKDLTVDPLLFFITTLFVLGAGLLFIRIYPYIISLVFALMKDKWPPVLYATFIQVGRSGGQEQFLMLFVILALSLGIFNANTARTVNRNMEDKIRYNTGADITIIARWHTNKESAMPGIRPGESGAGPDESETVINNEPLIYNEPPFRPYTELSGVELATKVFRRDDIQAISGNEPVKKIKLMGIIPNEFGKVSWLSQGLLPHHFFEYLNLMTDTPNAFLVSGTLRKKLKLKAGDPITISWGNQSYIKGVIYAFVDFWPAFNPNPAEKGGEPQNLIVANLSYIQAKTTLIEPYEIWIKKKPNVTDTEVYNDIKSKNLEINDIKFTNNQIIKEKNDPMLQGTNGTLTIGFVITMVISAIGFLIYWILSIKSRVLHFGIFRAMGLSPGKIIIMLFYEQILISGAAIVMGIFIGNLTSGLFVPLIQITYNAKDLVLPFRVFAYRADYIKIYAITGVILLAGISVLGIFVSRINIKQAIKLGED